MKNEGENVQEKIWLTLHYLLCSGQSTSQEELSVKDFGL